ncbi:hypothetical protein MIB92_14830 [Aestuariirhabdus sp. Z084]|uniref:hypothetical protein n=1 Tax=Aestuariirhabdus haliotis TaxID=2918751 RepID=UPI00201B4458|nr:hypothetical protein [Aestuariirhabdus haliotis]MCL6416934.1 hypothetical protein [Aestuariirhabdus haliotis]MCL6420963.1 hypothetical protein [Aestuariirhabdus haliotis]
MPTEKDRLGFIHDHLKMLATLSSAAIVVLVTLAYKFPSQETGISVAIAGFILSLLSSLVAQAILLINYPIGDFSEGAEYRGNAIDKSIFISWCLFFSSMVALASTAIGVLNA